MISATARLLQHRGYHGTSLSEILLASGAPRGSLYFHFPGGKQELALAATRSEIDAATTLLRESFDAHDDPGQGVRALFAAIGGYLAENGFTVGCPVAPLLLDAAGEEGPLAEVCQAALEEWRAFVRARLEAARIAPARAATLAMLIVAAEEGAILMARAQRDVAPLHVAAEELAAAISAAMKPPRNARARG